MGRKIKTSAPALTIEGRENHLIAIAMDEAEKRILDGTASSQLLTVFLKLGTTREKLEQSKLEVDVLLQNAKIENLKAMAEQDQLYANAIKAMGIYSGNVEADDEEF